MQGETDPHDEWREKLWLYVNFDCNLACRYCVADSSPRVLRPRLGLAIVRSLVDEAASLRFQQVAITGGEPLLHPDILPILEYASARLDTLLLTNATLTGFKSFRDLKELAGRKPAVQVSLDSAEPALHDRWRGKGSWKRAVEGITLLLEWGFLVSVRATITEQSDAEIEELRRFLEQLGIPRGRSYGVPVARGGRSKEGLKLGPADLQVEPTVAADGVYLHPLKVDPSLAAATTILPLHRALEQLAERAGDLAASGARRYR